MLRRLLDWLPPFRWLRAEQRRRDARVSEIETHVDHVTRRMEDRLKRDQYAEDYRRIGELWHR